MLLIVDFGAYSLLIGMSQNSMGTLWPEIKYYIRLNYLIPNIFIIFTAVY